MSDDQRESAIKFCGEQMQAWVAEHERSHCFSARGAADFWRLRMESLITGRSAAKVQTMESELGLA